MELCLYNAVFTAMSVDCKQYTYVNQLASSEKNPSKRFGWFTVCCCPPNILRLMGMIGGYTWNVSNNIKNYITQIDVHLHAPATFEFQTETGPESLRQGCDWPRDDMINFSLTSANKDVELMLRISRWAESWEVSSRKTC